MCGICGFVGIRQEGLLQAMTATLEHRGPDGFGYFESDGVGLGHRRLSIIDVEGGRQPLANEDDSVVVICNGEIYNHVELRNTLLARGHAFRTRSDSEVLVHLYEEYGDELVTKCVGMFAFALYDARRKRLLLARDRIGIKPLYYAELSGRLLFASESKALLQYAGLSATLDVQALHDYLALRYVPGPGGLFHEIKKLPAGHIAVVEGGSMRLKQYWRAELTNASLDASDDELLDAFAELFERSVRRRLMSDVPLGAYLSGGLDSNVIVAEMARLGASPVRTFTVGFDYEHDELAAAAETARLLGCDHTEIPCRVSDIALLPKVVFHLDEPVGDPIVIPMFQLAREAKRKVTVVLSGEGGDEVLGGYLFHKVLLAGHHLARAVPAGLRNGVLRRAAALTPARLMNVAFNYPADLGERGKQKVLDFLGLLDPAQLPAAYRHLISLFDQRDVQDLYTADLRSQLDGQYRYREEEEAVHSSAPYLNRIIHLQFAHWLADDILMKQDKMSMASAIEARVPFLDHEFVEYALQLPPRMKIRGWSSKHILRRYAERILPRRVARRRKMPFYLPLEKYVSHPAFVELMDDALSERVVRDRGLFRPEAVSRLRRSLATGEFVYAKQVFSLVVLELWFRTMVDRRAAAPVA